MGTLKLGIIKCHFPPTGDAIGLNRSDRTTEFGMNYRNILNTRSVDFISSEKQSPCINYYVLRNLGFKIQCSQIPASRDHCPSLAVYASDLWFDDRIKPKKINLDHNELMRTWLTGANHEEFLDHLNSKLQEKPAWMQVNDVDILWEGYEKFLIQKAQQFFEKKVVNV